MRPADSAQVRGALRGRAIEVLDEHVVNQIAAGEVVERPASVVKELVENALDAGAAKITVELGEGGKSLIRVVDDGCGIPPDQVELAFRPHATSKIRTADDLRGVLTLGFRGEALPSIAAVSRVELVTRTQDNEAAYRVEFVGGELRRSGAAAGPPGTSVSVRDLFYNTPVRFKFLKSTQAERRRCIETAGWLAIANPDVEVGVVSEGQSVFRTTGSGELWEAVVSVHGEDLAGCLLPVMHDGGEARVFGYIGRPDQARGNRSLQAFYLNGRLVSDRLLVSALEKAYAGLLPSRRYPLAVLFLEVPRHSVDVNVHPTKSEVRFRDSSAVYKAVLLACRRALDDELHSGTGPAVKASTPQEIAFPQRQQPLTGVRVSSRDLGSSSDYESAEIDVRQAGSEPSQIFYPERGISGGGARAGEGGPVQAAGGHGGPPRPGRAEQAERTDERASSWTDITVVGQLHLTYIVCETPTGMWLVDQHAAHERIIFERLLNRRESGREGPAVQRLLVPVKVSCTPTGRMLLEEYGPYLSELGYEVEPFGGNQFVLRGVPTALPNEWTKNDLTAYFEELIEALKDGRRAKAAGASAERTDLGIPPAVLESLRMTACRSAVLAGERLGREQMESILMQLRETKHPWWCPHGRPAIMALEWERLDAMFGRPAQEGAGESDKR